MGIWGAGLQLSKRLVVGWLALLLAWYGMLRFAAVWFYRAFPGLMEWFGMAAGSVMYVFHPRPDMSGGRACR